MFAEGTTVPVEKTRGEIEGMVRKHGASEFASGWNEGQAGISFVIKGRRVKFTVLMPDAGNKAIVDKARRMSRRNWGTPDADKLRVCVEAEERRRWRCLLLAIKAKLEIVSTGIATFEEEFLAHIVTADGQTVMERIRTAEVNGQRLLPPVAGA
jgi:hypothetical protein